MNAANGLAVRHPYVEKPRTGNYFKWLAGFIVGEKRELQNTGFSLFQRV